MAINDLYFLFLIWYHIFSYLIFDIKYVFCSLRCIFDINIKMKHNNVRQRVDPVLAPDQFSVAWPLAPEDLDRCVTQYGIYPSLPAPNGVLWSKYIRSQRNMSRSVSSSTEALDSDHARFITSRIAQHARTMAASTRSLPTNSPVPYFQPMKKDICQKVDSVIWVQ